MTGILSEHVDNRIPKVAEIEEVYGPSLERMTQKQKLYLSSVIAKKCVDIAVPETTQIFRKRCIAVANGITKKQDAIALLKYLAGSIRDE